MTAFEINKLGMKRYIFLPILFLSLIKVGKTQELDSLIHLSLEELLSVRITTANKQEQKLANVPASVVVITREDIEIYGYRTIPEILENTPGLYLFNDYGWYGASIGVRGFNTGRPKALSIMVNGVNQMYEADKGVYFENLGVPVETIERIEIIRGPMSVIYGSGAFLGAINIITNNFNEEGVEIKQTNFSYGSNNTYTIMGGFENNETMKKIRINIGGYKTDGPNFKYADMTNSPDILTQLGLDIARTTKGDLFLESKYADFNAQFNNLYFNMVFLESTKGNHVVFPTVTPGEQYAKTPSNAFVIGYKGKITNKLKFDLKYTYKKKSYDAKWSWLHEDFYGYFTRPEKTHIGEITTFFNPNDKLNLTTGLFFKQFSISDRVNVIGLGPSFSERIRNTERSANLAAFTQLDYIITPKIRVVAGLRVNYNMEYTIRKNYDFSLDPQSMLPSPIKLTKIVPYRTSYIPRIASIYSPNKNNAIKFLYGEAMNQPSFVDIVENMLEGATPPNLKPEKIKTIEINYIASLLASKMTINFSIYKNIMDDLVLSTAFIDENGDWYPHNHNLGKMVTIGGELSLTYKPWKKLNINISWTSQKSANEFEEMKGKPVVFSPNNLGYLQIAYFIDKKTSISINSTYVDKMKPFYDIQPSDPNNTDSPAVGYLGQDAPAYFLLGVNFRTRSLFKTGLYINLKLANALNQEIRYATYTYNSDWEDRGTIGPRREILISAGYKF